MMAKVSRPLPQLSSKRVPTGRLLGNSHSGKLGLFRSRERCTKVTQVHTTLELSWTDLWTRCALTPWTGPRLRTGSLCSGQNKFSRKSPTSSWESGKHNDFISLVTWKNSVHYATSHSAARSEDKSSITYPPYPDINFVPLPSDFIM